MKQVQQEIICILLQTLLDKERITQGIYEKARERALGTLDLPEFFCYDGDDGKKAKHGST